MYTCRICLNYQFYQVLWPFFPQSYNKLTLANEGERRRLHSLIADYLETLAREDGLRQAELMVHYIGANDLPRAARHYGEYLSDQELSGSTKTLAEFIIAGRDEDSNPGLEWTCSLLDQDEIGAGTIRWLCERFNFDLHDALINDTRLKTRFCLLQAARGALERLAESDPTNAAWQRDLWVSYWKIADVLERSGDHKSMSYWRRAYDILSGMKRRGLFVSPQDEGFLEQLRRKAGIR